MATAVFCRQGISLFVGSVGREITVRLGTPEGPNSVLNIVPPLAWSKGRRGIRHKAKETNLESLVETNHRP